MLVTQRSYSTAATRFRPLRAVARQAADMRSGVGGVGEAGATGRTVPDFEPRQPVAAAPQCVGSCEGCWVAAPCLSLLFSRTRSASRCSYACRGTKKGPRQQAGQRAVARAALENLHYVRLPTPVDTGCRLAVGCRATGVLQRCVDATAVRLTCSQAQTAVPCSAHPHACRRQGAAGRPRAPSRQPRRGQADPAACGAGQFGCGVCLWLWPLRRTLLALPPSSVVRAASGSRAAPGGPACGQARLHRASGHKGGG